jgi:FAD/FMN-containing dehydrogenase
MSYEQKKEKLLRELGEGPVALGKSTSNLFRHRSSGKRKIDVRHFNKILDIDSSGLVADVEGMTQYIDLVAATLKHGCLPTVVPELKSITIGGAVSGVGIESSSFRYGLVHESILEMEILLDGKVVVASPTKNKDLFFGFPNSYGTLGYILKLKVKLVKAKKFVKLRHFRFSDSVEYFKMLKEVCLSPVDFVDGTVFRNKEMYITTGEFVDSIPFVSDYTHMNIYYKSIREGVDYLKVADYIWRWDTDWFWCSKHFFVQNKLVRWLVGKKRLNSVTYWKIRALSHKVGILDWIRNVFHRRKESVVQDIEVPLENAASFLEFFNKEIGIRPVWVCPVMPQKKFDLYPMDKKLYVNFGFWDVVRTKEKDGYYNQKIENEVTRLNGKKSLYSTSHYSRIEFFRLYGGAVYKKLKKKYDPAGKFGDMYEKCVKGH